MRTSVFWTKPDKLQIERNADPLGIDALCEAMSTVLAPCLTKGTSAAEDYIWVLVGLNWALKGAGSGFEVKIWPSFQCFERALKQYWWREHIHRHFSGSKMARDLCEESRPNLNVSLLKNERGAGLLGTYITSLRSIGLVDRHSLRLTDDGSDVIRGLEFAWPGHAVGSWERLNNIFSCVRIRPAHKERLGIHLFKESAMQAAAKALLARKNAIGWHSLSKDLPLQQGRIARACPVVNNWAKEALNAFVSVLDGVKRISPDLRHRLKDTAHKVVATNPFPIQWGHTKLKDELSLSLREMSHRTPEGALLALHKNVMTERHGRAPWIISLGNKSLVHFDATSHVEDYRFGNFKRLLKETRWGIASK